MFAQIQRGIDFLEGCPPDGSSPRINLDGVSSLMALPWENLGRFWSAEDHADKMIGRALRVLFGGLKETGMPWGWVLRGGGGRVSMYWLVPGGEQGCETWRQMASAVFPSSRFGTPTKGNQLLDPSLDAGMVLVGRNPCKVEENDGMVLDASSMANAMRGGNWIYLVLAQGSDCEEMAEDLGHWQSEERNTRRTFMRRGTAEETNQPLARRYLDLIEAEQSRLEEGTREGMWDVQACLMASPAGTLAAGMQAIQGQLASPRLSLGTWLFRHGVSGKGGNMILSRLTTRETAALVALPREELVDVRMHTRVTFAQSGAGVPEPAITVGRVLADGHPLEEWFKVPLHDLCRHALICGLPGSGKSHTTQLLLRQLWEEHRIPFLIIDPVKSDHRSLLRSPLGGDLRVFTPGLEAVAPLRFNPLAVPPGVPVQRHVDGLVTLLQASFGMPQPMPVVLARAVHELYASLGWNFVTGIHPLGYEPEVQPQFRHLILVLQRLIPVLGWAPEVTANLNAGLVTRLESLTLGAKGQVLSNEPAVDMGWLLEGPALIELANYGTSEENAFLLGAMLLALRNHRMQQGASRRLRHVVLVEEAHRLLSAPRMTAGQEQAQPQAKAVEEFCQLLAEIRAYGQGLVVVEQMPTMLASDMIANTALKICHQLVSAEERKTVGDSMNLRSDQREFLATLPTGDAVVFRSGNHAAFHIHVPNHPENLAYGGEEPSSEEVRQHMLNHPSN